MFPENITLDSSLLKGPWLQVIVRLRFRCNQIRTSLQFSGRYVKGINLVISQLHVGVSELTVVQQGTIDSRFAPLEGRLIVDLGVPRLTLKWTFPWGLGASSPKVATAFPGMNTPLPICLPIRPSGGQL